MITYRLSPEELELAKTGRLSEIPTGADRGIKDIPESIRKTKLQSTELYFGKSRAPQKYKHITAEYLMAQKDAGRTMADVAREHNMPPGTMSYYLGKYGLRKQRKIKR